MNFLQLVNQTKLELGVEGAALVTVSSQTGMPGKLVSWVAQADSYIQALHFDWDFLWKQFAVSTQIGISAYSRPSDLGLWDRESFWLDYSLATSTKLRVFEYRKYRDQIRPGVKTNARPTVVTIKPDKNLVLDPPPDAVYSMTADYWQKPVVMADSTDTSLIPEQYHRVIIARAKLFYAEEEEVATLRQDALAEYLEQLDKLEAHQLPEQERRAQGEATLLEVRTE